MSEINQARPFTHRTSVEAVCNELDHADMVVLSGLFRRWALYDPICTAELSTTLIQYSADMERIAEWAGEEWEAAGPSPQPSLLRFLADAERQRPGVIRLSVDTCSCLTHRRRS